MRANPRFNLTHALLLSTGAVAGYAVRALAQRRATTGNFWARAFAPTPDSPAATSTPQVKPKRQRWLANPGIQSPEAHDLDLVWCVLRSGVVVKPCPAAASNWLQTGSSGDIMWWYPGAAQPDLPPPDYAEDGTSSIAPTPYLPHWLPHSPSATAEVPWFLDDETPVWCRHYNSAVTGPQPAHRVNWRTLGQDNDVTHYSRSDPAIFEVLAKPAVFVAKAAGYQWMANPGNRQAAPAGLVATQSVWYVERCGATGMALQANHLRWEHYGSQHPADIMWYCYLRPTGSPRDMPDYAAFEPYGTSVPYVHAWLPVKGDDNIRPRFLNPAASVWLQHRDGEVSGPHTAGSVNWLHRGAKGDVLQYSRAKPASSATWHVNPGDSSAPPKPLHGKSNVWVKTRAGQVSGPYNATRVTWLHDPFMVHPDWDVTHFSTGPQNVTGRPTVQRVGFWEPNHGASENPPENVTWLRNTKVWVLRRTGDVTGPHAPRSVDWRHGKSGQRGTDVLEYTTDPQP